jgi:hypothetical protein
LWFSGGWSLCLKKCIYPGPGPIEGRVHEN